MSGVSEAFYGASRWETVPEAGRGALTKVRPPPLPQLRPPRPAGLAPALLTAAGSTDNALRKPYKAPLRFGSSTKAAAGRASPPPGSQRLHCQPGPSGRRAQWPGFITALKTPFLRRRLSERRCESRSGGLGTLVRTRQGLQRGIGQWALHGGVNGTAFKPARNVILMQYFRFPFVLFPAKRGNRGASGPARSETNDGG